MTDRITTYIRSLSAADQAIGELLADTINQALPRAESKVWHAHPVWFLDGNPIVGFSRLKAGIRLMFWSGASFDEEKLKAGTGKFKDASILFTDVGEVDQRDLKRWLRKAREIQWDYKNVVKRKGKLVKLK